MIRRQTQRYHSQPKGKSSHKSLPMELKSSSCKDERNATIDGFVAVRASKINRSTEFNTEPSSLHSSIHRHASKARRDALDYPFGVQRQFDCSILGCGKGTGTG